MRIAVAILLVLLPLPAVHAESGLAAIVEDLASPYEDTRHRAVELLARAGDRADADLLALYPRADFRTRALILDTFARDGRPSGLELIYGDLDDPDRGVVLAQRRYVSAVFGAARDYAVEKVVPGIAADDWRTLEALRALPGRGPTPQRVLTEVARGARGAGVTASAARLAKMVEAVDGMRKTLARLGKEGPPLARRRAGQLSSLLFRHEVERALFAVSEAGADGYYDGMYRLVGELTEAEGAPSPDPLTILFRIATDRPFPEAGVPPGEGAGYRLAEPMPAGADAYSVRVEALSCLGDVGRGHPEAAKRLQKWLEEDSDGDYDSIESIPYWAALACANMGAPAPLRSAVREFRERLGRPGMMDYIEERLRTRLAAAYSHLGEFDRAAEVYRKMLVPGDTLTRYNLACVLARSGHAEDALEQLRLAVDDGYGLDPSQVGWLLRDGDLESVRKLPGFTAVLAAARQKLR